MLLFIPIRAVHNILIIEISIHLMLLFILTKPEYVPIIEQNFNTSHVTVYLKPLSTLMSEMRFQYISCYCLSGMLTN